MVLCTAPRLPQEGAVESYYNEQQTSVELHPFVWMVISWGVRLYNHTVSSEDKVSVEAADLLTRVV